MDISRTNEVTTVTVPPVWWDDYRERLGGHSDAGGPGTSYDFWFEEVKRTSRGVVVNVTNDRLQDMIGDADLYATPGEFPDMGIGFLSSARAALKRLRKIAKENNIDA